MLREVFLVAQLFPAIHWHENRIFDSRGRVWGVYRLPQFPYEHRGHNEQWSVSEKFERFLHMYSGLKKWMERFQGVATKYLDNYLFWFRFLERYKDLSPYEAKRAILRDMSKRVCDVTVEYLRSV